MTPGALLEGLGPLILGSQTTSEGPISRLVRLPNDEEDGNKDEKWGEVIGPCP